MIKTLRGRLVSSYILVIITVLILLAISLLGFVTLSDVRFLQPLQRLATISSSHRYELLQLINAGINQETLQQSLYETAAEQDVRILIADTSSRQVIFDSDPSASWLGVHITNIGQTTGLFTNIDRNAIFGRFRHPTNGSSWLVYARPLTNFNRFLIFYAQPETRPLAFFREFFLRPLFSAGFIALLISILLALLISRSVSKPLRRMAFSAAAIAEGDYDQEVPPQGPDEVKQVAHSFNKMAAQVKQTQQAQQDFVANVSHDLKTPITSIQGWSQALLDGTAVTRQEQEQAAGIIHNESERMARMVAQLLDLARLESGELNLNLNLVDVAALLHKIHHNLALRAQEKDVDLTLDVQPVPPVNGDRDRLMQIFTNLIDNALTHTPAGGRVHVTLRRQDEKHIIIQVEDSGAGIPAAELPRIFERFYQVDKSRTRSEQRRGSGLGLAITKELVEAHHGRLFAASQPGEGSTFTVHLPVSDTAVSHTDLG